MVNFTGILTRLDAITGELKDKWGWRLALTGTLDGPGVIHLTATLAHEGDLPALWTNESDFYDALRQPDAKLVGTLSRTGAEWHGRAAGCGALMTLDGTQAEPGVMALRGTVEAVVWVL